MNATLALPRLLRQQGRPRHWRRHGHREGTGVNEVAPGYIETTINEAGRQELAQYQCMADRTDFMRWGSLTMSPAG
jgi:NAD(P)-dependent dehydrogenase (short-subunit alcohol dehydrogenase family)